MLLHSVYLYCRISIHCKEISISVQQTIYLLCVFVSVSSCICFPVLRLSFHLFLPASLSLSVSQFCNEAWEQCLQAAYFNDDNNRSSALFDSVCNFECVCVSVYVCVCVNSKCLNEWLSEWTERAKVPQNDDIFPSNVWLWKLDEGGGRREP